MLRTCTLYGWLAAAFVTPSGIVAPYAAEHGGGAATIGALLAAPAVGAGLATWLLTTRVPPSTRPRFLVAGSLLACAPLILTATDPGVPAVAALWGLVRLRRGVPGRRKRAFQSAVPNERRGAAFGIVTAGLLGGQGLAMLAVAALSELMGTAEAVAVFGAAGTLAALALAPAGRRLTATKKTPTSLSS